MQITYCHHDDVGVSFYQFALPE